MPLVSRRSTRSPSQINHNVTVSQWQKTPNISGKYVIFRWMIFTIFSFIITCSLVDVGRNKKSECKGSFLLKWPIYLTHWTMTFCLLQSLIAALLTSIAYAGKKCDFLLKIYRGIYANAATFGFTITIWYWTLIHKPEIHPIDLQNVLAHVMIGLAMFIDLAISGHKLTINKDIFASVGVAIGYTVFSYIYFVLGGTNCDGEDQIYPVLNWNNASKTWLFCAGKAVFVAFVHLIAYGLCRLRIFMFERFCSSPSHLNETYCDEKFSYDIVNHIVETTKIEIN